MPNYKLPCVGFYYKYIELEDQSFENLLYGTKKCDLPLRSNIKRFNTNRFFM